MTLRHACLLNELHFFYNDIYTYLMTLTTNIDPCINTLTMDQSNPSYWPTVSTCCRIHRSTYSPLQHTIIFVLHDDLEKQLSRWGQSASVCCCVYWHYVQKKQHAHFTWPLPSSQTNNIQWFTWSINGYAWLGTPNQRTSRIEEVNRVFHIPSSNNISNCISRME